MHLRSIIFLALTILMSVSACKKNQMEQLNDESGLYFPMDSGYRWTYQYDSIAYKSKFGTDTASFLQRHTVAEILPPVSGLGTTYRIEVHNQNGSKWEFDRNYFITIGANEVIRTDQDVDELILSMPFVRFKTWDGHQYSTEPESEYYLDLLYQPKEIEGQAYDSTVTVMHDIESNPLNSLIGEEVFAKHIGLVWRLKDRRYTISTPSETSGYKLSQRLIDFEI